MSDLKLDVFAYFLPQPYFERLKALAPENPDLAAMLARWRQVPALWNLEDRIRLVRDFKGYRQVLTLALPAIESLAGPEESPALARLANEGLAEVVALHPDQFPAFVASLPMNNVPAALAETDYAITRLGAKGIQVFTDVNGRWLGEPEFFRVIERCVKKYRLPVWLRVPRPDARDAESAAAIERIAASGRLEGLRGAAILTPRPAALAGIPKRARPFYGGTPVAGAVDAVCGGLEALGADRLLLGTECPLDGQGGHAAVRESLRAIAALELPETARGKICYGNALRLLQMKLAVSPGGRRVLAVSSPGRSGARTKK